MTRHSMQVGIAALLMMAATISAAGPLDRTPEARSNPAVDDMMRIPGVVGQSRSEACMILQQAGLNPEIKLVKRAPSQNQAMECKVISQSPLPGGVAMIGSTVEITIYAPKECADQAADGAWQEEIPGNETQWPGDEEETGTPGGDMQHQLEPEAQPDEPTQQAGTARVQTEKQLPKKLQPKKIDWKPIPHPQTEKSAPSVPRPGNLKDRSPAPASALTRAKAIKGEEGK